MIKARLSICWLVAVLVIFGLGACQSIHKKNKYNQQGPDFHTTRISFNWIGVYSGIVTSTNGQKISVSLHLKRDETFELGYSYLDKADNFFSARGKFKWDKTEGKINLKLKDFPSYYWVNSKGLIQLDSEWNIITDNYEENYMLKKIK